MAFVYRYLMMHLFIYKLIVSKEGSCCSLSSKVSYYGEVGFKNGCDGTFGGKTRHECVLRPGNFFLTLL